MFRKSIDIDKDLMLKNKIPLLYRDEDWNALFSDFNNKSIQEAKNSLSQLVEKENELEYKSRELQKEKIQAMKMILGVSDSINNNNKIENLKLLDEYKERIIKINSEIEDITFQLEILPSQIRESNLELLKLTLRFGYDELKIREKIVSDANEELDILRKRLKEILETKYQYEEWVTKTYTFFHGLLGPEAIQKIDEERLK